MANVPTGEQHASTGEPTNINITMTRPRHLPPELSQTTTPGAPTTAPDQPVHIGHLSESDFRFIEMESTPLSADHGGPENRTLPKDRAAPSHPNATAAPTNQGISIVGDLVESTYTPSRVCLKRPEPTSTIIASTRMRHRFS